MIPRGICDPHPIYSDYSLLGVGSQAARAGGHMAKMATSSVDYIQVPDILGY
jgi:hypothetical protein